MKHLSMSAEALTNGSASQAGETLLSGSWLLVVRSVWAVFALLSVGLFIASALVYFIGLHGYQPGVYDHLIHTTAVVSGYTAIIFHYAPFSGASATVNVELMTALVPLWIVVGCVIFWRRSDDWMALFVALVLVMASTSYSPTSYVFTLVLGTTSPMGILDTVVQALAWSSLVLLFALFPDGRPVPGWTRWGFLVSLACMLLWAVPSNWAFSVVHWPPWLFASVELALALTLVYAQFYRYHSVSTALQRQQTKWVVFALILGALADIANFVPMLLFPSLRQPGLAHILYNAFSETTFVLFLFVPLAIGFAVLRYRLWDIDLLINRTLVYGLLTACIIGLYILVVVLLGTLLSVPGNLFISLLATGFVAVLFHPLRERLRQAVNRLMFGDRDDPYRILSRLGSHLETTLSTDSVLPTIVETVAQALKLPYAAIAWKPDATCSQSLVAASYGKTKEQHALVCIPLVYQQEQVGELWLAPRRPTESLTPADLRLLHELARQLGVAVHAVRLTADLQRLTSDLQHSRERLVSAHEEERLRLRRDLHDGLGPRLASLTLKLETARNRLSYDPLADKLLSDLILRTQEAVADIRHLVYALRPIALDELGLLPALQEQVLQYSDQGSHEIHIVLEAPEQFPPLPAAVEVAIFRIVQEALTNVVRHSAASRCVVRLNLHEQERLLELEIEDNGRGFAPGWSMGVGLASMRERAEELGGTWEVAQVPTGGTCVHVRLPSLLPSEVSVQASGVAQQREGAS